MSNFKIQSSNEIESSKVKTFLSSLSFIFQNLILDLLFVIDLKFEL